MLAGFSRNYWSWRFPQHSLLRSPLLSPLVLARPLSPLPPDMAHVLIIDDEVLIRRSVRKFLEMSGHKVAEAEDGEVGIRMHASLLYDVVITDANMPGVNGSEVVRELRRVDEGVKLIVITGGGKSDTSPARKGPVAVGDVVSLKKPFSLQELLEVVNLLTGQASTR